MDKKMTITHIISQIKEATEAARENGNYTAELHLQIIKHSDVLQNLSGKEFCDALGISDSYKVEFNKMINIAPRLKTSGLSVDKI